MENRSANKATKTSFLKIIQNLPFSPGRDKRPDVNWRQLKSHLTRGLSGPIVSMIPAEARGKSKNFETQEPTSPKVSCMGQIKHKNNICRNKPASNYRPEKISKIRPAGSAPELKRKPLGLKRIFASGRKSDAAINRGKPPAPDRAPSLSQMRRFASSRDSFADFDWAGDGDFYSDEDGGFSDGEDDVIVPYSAPIFAAGVGAGGLSLEPRKEINLWRRRTMAQPKPLELNTVRAQ